MCCACPPVARQSSWSPSRQSSRAATEVHMPAKCDERWGSLGRRVVSSPCGQERRNQSRQSAQEFSFIGARNLSPPYSKYGGTPLQTWGRLKAAHSGDQVHTKSIFPPLRGTRGKKILWPQVHFSRAARTRATRKNELTPRFCVVDGRGCDRGRTGTPTARVIAFSLPSSCLKRAVN